MKLNCYLIKDYMKIKVLKHRINTDMLERPLTGITFYRPGKPIDAALITLIHLEDLTALLETQDYGCFICAGSVLPPVEFVRADVLLTEDADLLDLYDDICQVFHAFDDFEHEVDEQLKADAALNVIFNISLKFLYNPLSVYSKDMRLIAYSERKKDPRFVLYQEYELNAYLPDEEIEELKVDEAYLKTYDTTVPSIFPSDRWGYRILSQNIRIDGEYIARIMLLETDRALKFSDYSLLLYVADAVTYLMKKKNMAMNTHPSYLDESLFTLLKGSKPNQTLLNIALSDLGWNMNDSYLCSTILASQYDKVSVAVSTAALRLERTMPATIALQDNGNLIVLTNLSRSSLDKDTVLQQLVYFLRESIMKAGISREFRDLSRLRDYYHQAVTALTLGEKFDPMIWSYRYEKYALSHLLADARDNACIDSLIPTGLRRLIDYDRENNRDFTMALRVYLRENMHIMNTIRVLYMQRATFLYQLKRIQEISDLKLDDPKVRLELLMVFEIMDEDGIQY